MSWFNPAFWSGLSGPGVAVLVAGLFVWALSTERLVLGKQYRAERARADKYDDANQTLTGELIKMTSAQQTIADVIAALRTSIDHKEDA